MRAQLYLDIQSRLQAILGTDNLPLIKHFDLWNQNVQFMEEETPFTTPAVFVEFLPIQWESHGLKVQRAELVFRLHVVTRWMLHTAFNGPDQDTAVSYLDIPENIYAKMQYNSAGSSNGFVRTNSVINHNHGSYVDSVEEYKTYIINTKAVDELQSVSNVTPVITEQIPN